MDLARLNLRTFVLQLLFLYLSQYRLLKSLAVRHQHVIHEECGRPLHSTPMAGQHIAPHFQYSGPCMQVLFKIWDIQSCHRSIDEEIIQFEMRLVLEQHIMHRPEAVLQGGGFRGFRCELGMRMFLDQGKMSVHEPEMVGQSPPQSTDEIVRLPRVGAFEIGVGNNGNPPTPDHMIVRQHNKIISITPAPGLPRHSTYAFPSPPV